MSFLVLDISLQEIFFLNIQEVTSQKPVFC